MWKAVIPEVPNPYLCSEGKWLDLRFRYGSPPKDMRLSTRKRWAVYEWMDGFPQDYSQELSLVSDELFWGALSVLSRIPEGRELFRDNPAWTLLSYYGWRYSLKRRPAQSFQATRQALRHRKRELLGQLGFPAEERGVKLLRKLSTKNCGQLALNNFCEVWKSESPILNLLQHRQFLEPELLNLVALLVATEKQDGVMRLNPEVVMRLSNGSECDRVRTSLKEARQKEQYLQSHSRLSRLPLSVKKELECPKPFRTIEALMDWCGELDLLCHYIKDRKRMERPLLSAPLPADQLNVQGGSVQIHPFRTRWELYEHSRRQQNCLSEGLNSSRERLGRYFEVTSDFAPMHSLEIEPFLDGWRIKMLLGPNNSSPHPGISRAVDRWVSTHGASQKAVQMRQIVSSVFGGNEIQTYKEEDELLAL